MQSEFDADLYELAYPDGAEHHWWHGARNRIILDTYRRLGDAGAVLDIGCGRGIVVQYLRGRGVDCRGVELGDATPMEGVAPFVRMRTSAFDLPEEERNRVTTVLLLDVLEHLPDPSQFLRDIAAAFRNLKYVIVTVPARQELWSNHDEFYGHLRRYDIAQCVQVIGEPQWISYFFHALYPIARLLKKREVALTAPKPSLRWLHRLIAAVFTMEYAIVPRRVAGTSIIAAARWSGSGARTPQ